MKLENLNVLEMEWLNLKSKQMKEITILSIIIILGIYSVYNVNKKCNEKNVPFNPFEGNFFEIISIWALLSFMFVIYAGLLSKVIKWF